MAGPGAQARLRLSGPDPERLTWAQGLVRAGLGYSVLSASEFVEEQRMGLLDKRLIIRPQLEQTLYLCHLSGGQLSRSAKHVSRLALQLIETMVANASWPGLAEDRSVDAVVRRVAFG